MRLNWNQVVLAGKIYQDAYMGSTKSGKTTASFTLGVSEKRWDKKNGTKWETHWVRISAFGNEAEKATKFKKGDTVMVVGRFDTRKDDQNKVHYQIVADKIGYIDGEKVDNGYTASENKVFMSGFVGRIEEKVLPSGSQIANIGLGLRNNRNIDGEWKELPPTYVDVTALGYVAKGVLEQASDGDEIYISGGLQSQTWGEGEDKRSKLVVKADEIRSYKMAKKVEEGEDVSVENSDTIDDLIDDLPF